MIIHELKGLWHFWDFGTAGWQTLSGIIAEDLSYLSVSNLNRCHIPFKMTIVYDVIHFTSIFGAQEMKECVYAL